MANSRTAKIYLRKNILIFFMMLLLMVFLLLKQGFAQDAKAPQASLKNSVSLCFSLFGPELLGGSFNYYTSNRFSINTGLGFNQDFHVGTNYYFTKRESRGSSFYFGLQIVRYREFLISIWGSKPEPATQLGLYAPVGFEYVGRKGLAFQLEMGPNIVSTQWYSNNQFPINTSPVLVSLKIGGIIN